MRVEYELKFRDYLLFNVVHQLLSVPVQGVLLVIAGALGLLSLRDHGPRAVVLGVMICYLAMWIVQLIFTVIYLYSSKNTSFLTKHVIELQDDAIYEETKFSRSYHYWPGVQRIVHRPGYFAVYINAHSAHIIPIRAFTTNDEASRFLSLAQTRLRAAAR